jgi:hypothetical protein
MLPVAATHKLVTGYSWKSNVGVRLHRLALSQCSEHRGVVWGTTGSILISKSWGAAPTIELHPDGVYFFIPRCCSVPGCTKVRCADASWRQSKQSRSSQHCRG